MTFGSELVGLLTKISMFGKFLSASLEVVRRFEQRPIRIDSMRVNLIFGAKVSLVLNAPNKVALHSESITTAEDAPQVERNG